MDDQALAAGTRGRHRRGWRAGNARREGQAPAVEEVLVGAERVLDVQRPVTGRCPAREGGERIRREYNASVTVGAPNVSYREAPTREAAFNYRHKKQTGGSGQFAHIIGRIIPLSDDVEAPYEFEDNIKGGRIPREYIPAVSKGFVAALASGPLAGYEIVGCRMCLDDGSYHAVDSSEMAFRTAGREAFRQAFTRSKPVLQEPIMSIEVETPLEYQGSLVGDLNIGDSIHSLLTINKITHARLEELFIILKNRLGSALTRQNLPCGVILTGGVSKTPMIEDLAEITLDVSVTIGQSPDWIKNADLFEPEYATVLGLLYNALYDQRRTGESKKQPQSGWLRKMAGFFA